MGATQTNKKSPLGKWMLSTVFIFGAVLVISSIWSIYRALNNSSPADSGAPAEQNTAINTGLSQEEMIRRHDMAEQQPAQVIQPPAAAQPAVIPTNQNDNEVILQKAKTKVHQKIVERMKQYVKDHPSQDNRELEEQIKKRENQGAQSQ